MWRRFSTILVASVLLALMIFSPTDRVEASHLGTQKILRQLSNSLYLQRSLSSRSYSTTPILPPLFSEVQKDPEAYKIYLKKYIDIPLIQRYTMSSGSFVSPFHNVFNQTPESASIDQANALLTNLTKLTIYPGTLDRVDDHCFMKDKNCQLPLLKKGDFVVNPRFWSTSPQIPDVSMIYDVNHGFFRHYSGSLEHIWQQNKEVNFGRHRDTLIKITGPHFGRLLWGASLYPHQIDIMVADVEDTTPECVLSPLHLFKVQTVDYRENVIWLDLQSLPLEQLLDMMKSQQLIVSSTTGHRRRYADYVSVYHKLGLMPSGTELFYKKLTACL